MDGRQLLELPKGIHWVAQNLPLSHLLAVPLGVFTSSKKFSLRKIVQVSVLTGKYRCRFVAGTREDLPSFA